MKLFYSILISAFMLTSCSKALIGSGNVITQNRQIEAFSAITSVGDFDINIIQSPNSSLKIKGEDNVLSKVQTNVVNGRLTINYESGIQTHKHEKVTIEASTQNLNAIQLNGSGSIQSATKWISPAFTTGIDGSGTINTLFETDILHVTINGSGKVYISGTSEASDLNISGSGSIFGFSSSSKEVNSSISGSGKIEVTAIQKLNSSITGSGKVYYKGSPVVSIHTNGSGGVVNAN